LHSGWMAVTFVDCIVELVACWTIIMLIYGLFLWFPIATEKIKGAVTILFNKRGRIRQRDFHAVPAFWISGGLLFFLLSGMLWTGVWGNRGQQLTTASDAGYPPSIWVGHVREATTVAEDVGAVSRSCH